MGDDQPQPLGYAAGDPDVHGYCLDDPVNMVDPVGLEGGFWGGMKKIGAGFGKLFEKAPAGIAEAVVEGTKGAGQAFERLGHEYATNKDLQKYTGIALGAGALPLVVATAPQTLPAVGRAVSTVARGAKTVAGAAKSKVNEAATTAAGTILSNPEKASRIAKEAGDFLSSATVTGPPENSVGGYAGGLGRWAYDKINENITGGKKTGR